MSDPVIVVPYDKTWKDEFQMIGGQIRQALGEIAVRIDHIGSTSVTGLDAKPVIDIQISVDSLEPMDYRLGLEALGYIYRADNPDLTKRYFRESGSMRRTHIHVRESGSWPEQFALLFRDYLREHLADCKRYADVKYQLAEKYQYERERYVEEKEPVIWEIARKAHSWSQQVGWKPGKTDI
ncbi:GrpB family protein [Paenibacillus sp. N3/727]|uniref:GrpB family protein n=1 Tax=Paenibacillus sp. N3/727 TaxID=2925845 RepID=UPI001F53C88E|nr:GrpB family protein [Paenibacillus sp. N3/727]UNK16893.1 GrpB family protein [Paenibacillus sp. N3/727]